MALQNMRQQLTGGQDIRSDVANKDFANKWSAMSALPGAEMQDAQFQRGTQEFNINQALEQQGLKQQRELAEYKENIRAWAAARTADAMAGNSSGSGSGSGSGFRPVKSAEEFGQNLVKQPLTGGFIPPWLSNPVNDAIDGCFITTAVCDKLGLPDDNYVLNSFRTFRDEHMGGKGEVSEYYDVAPKIVAKIADKGDEDVYYEVLSDWLMPALKEIEHKNYDKAQEIYTEMVKAMKDKYLKE